MQRPLRKTILLQRFFARWATSLLMAEAAAWSFAAYWEDALVCFGNGAFDGSVVDTESYPKKLIRKHLRLSLFDLMKRPLAASRKGLTG